MKSGFHWALTAALLLQAVLYYSASGGDRVPLARPLGQFPAQFDGWRLYQESPVEKEVLDVLRADDVLSRVYVGANGVPASLFVAYFRSQRTGQAPHSPQNCLPGSGWIPSRVGFLEVRLPGRPEPVQINRYVVSKGDSKSVVLYWYQSRDRIIASEFSAKFWLVADSIRYHRSDTALVRVVVPVPESGEASATEAALSFVQAAFPALSQFLPS
jgi:EpsI family protein